MCINGSNGLFMVSFVFSYFTVTLFARLRGLSGSVLLSTASWLLREKGFIL